MRAGVLTAARALALAGPTALAFFAGGYFDEARAWAGLGAWAGVFLAAVAGARLPRSRPAALALVGLALLAVWTLLSMLWAPVVGNAYHAGQIALLYLGALLGSAMLFANREVRLVEPLLALGTVIVIAYGLSERFLPGLLQFSASISADGRLEQPLTYWNAMGELAAIGLVLCARLMGDRDRPNWLRCAAAAAVTPLGMGLYISFSRGSIFAAAAGLVALVVIAPEREQLASLLLSLATTVLAALSATPFRGVTGLEGSLGQRERDGAIALGLLVIIALVSAVAQRLLIRRLRPGRAALPRWAPAAATAVVCLGLGLAIVVGAKEKGTGTKILASGSSRLITLQSNRYAYWDVALRAFKTSPVYGVGAGNWSGYWLRWRTITEAAQDAHSLPLQTLAELGIVGAAALLVFLVGLFRAAYHALRATARTAGPIAALITYVVHSPLDWDWQMPALTLVAMVLAGVLLAESAAARTEPSGGELQTASGA